MGDSIIRGQEQSFAQFANYLTDLFKTQYGNQQDILKALTSKFTDMVNNPQGFSQATLSALRGGSVDTLSKQFQAAQQAVGAQQAVNGGAAKAAGVTSGVEKQIQGQMAGQMASSTAGALDTIQQENEQQKIQNQRIGLSGLGEVAAMENPQSYGSEATGTAATVGNLGSEYFNTDQSGFFDVLGRSFASGLGNTLSGGNSTGKGGTAGFFGYGG